MLPRSSSSIRPEKVKVSTELWIRLCHETAQGVFAMINGARVLIRSRESTRGDIAIAAGLYTFAVEEYGKLAYLLTLTPKGGKVSIDYLNVFRRHELKFKLAIERLPGECLSLKSGSSESEVSFGARLAIFYTDFDEKSPRGIVELPAVDPTKLMEAMEKLEAIVMPTRIPSLRDFKS